MFQFVVVIVLDVFHDLLVEHFYKDVMISKVLLVILFIKNDSIIEYQLINYNQYNNHQLLFSKQLLSFQLSHVLSFLLLYS